MKKNTLIVQTGRRKDWTHGIVNPPVYHASTVLFDTVADLNNAIRNRATSLYYGRRGTPTSFALAEALTELEGGAGCSLYPSGLAAVCASILAFVAHGDHILVSDSVYDPTRNFCDQQLKRMGVETTYFDPQIADGIGSLIKKNTSLIFLESPGSITMEIQDVPAITKIAKKYGVKVILDNTWASPLYFRPLEHGVDVSVQAATKYIVGHSDAMLGAAIANKENYEQLRENSYQLGYCAAPDDVYLALRGLRTLDVRLKQHEKNALTVAHWLQQHECVDHVRHPALADFPGHDIWARDFDGSTGLFSFVLKSGSEKAVTAMLDGMQHFKMGFSWGGYESLILAYHGLKKYRTATNWSAPGPLLRLHIGLEDPEDLIEDLSAGFARLLAESD